MALDNKLPGVRVIDQEKVGGLYFEPVDSTIFISRGSLDKGQLTVAIVAYAESQHNIKYGGGIRDEGKAQEELEKLLLNPLEENAPELFNSLPRFNHGGEGFVDGSDDT